MINLMEIKGYKAVIIYDSEIEMFRGEFTGINGGTGFNADNIINLKKEGAISLQVFLDACQERGIEPKKEYSGKFNVRLPTKLHENGASISTAEGKSLNQWVIDTFNHAVR
jgi:predicted HicB family RNase H-like nuclease